MTPVETTARLPSEVSPLRGTARILAQIFLVTLPFCAMIKPGLLGNFDANLSLYPFLLLLPLLLINGMLVRSVMRLGAEGDMIRAFAFILFLAAFMTIVHGYILSAQGVRDYGLNPFTKSIVAAIVPIFLLMLFSVGIVLGQRLPADRLQTWMNAAFWITVGYALLELSSVVVSNPLYDAFWPVLEGSRDNGGISYIERFRRLSGPTMEPAEMAKLMLVFFLPFLVFPVWRRRSLLKIALTFLLALASLSIIGVAITALGIVSLFLSSSISGKTKGIILVVCYIALLPLLSVGDILFSQLINRLSNIGTDPSAIVRVVYNLAAVEIIQAHPIFGIGWSNEIFYFPEKISQISFLWEVRRDLSEGNALTAKSLLLRLTMYLGLPLMCLLFAMILWSLFSPRTGGSPTDRSRTRMAFLLLGVASILDGGIITSFYMWVTPALCLGVQMRSRATSARPCKAPSISGLA